MHDIRTTDRVLHGIASIGPLIFFAVASIEGAVRPGYDPIEQPISALALGPRGWIQGLNFALLAASLISFTLVLRRALRSGTASWVGPGLFGVMSFGILLAGAFAMDPPGASPTLAGNLHLAGGFLFFPWMPVAVLLVARRFRRDGDWRSHYFYTLATGLFCLATIVFFLLFVGPPGTGPRVLPEIAGLVQRLQLLPFFVWIAIVARHAFRLAYRSEPEPAQHSTAWLRGPG